MTIGDASYGIIGAISNFQIYSPGSPITGPGSIATETQCICKTNSYLNGNNTCSTSCYSPYIKLTISGQLTCQKPCYNYPSSYYYYTSEGTCQPTCSAPYVAQYNETLGSICSPNSSNPSPDDISTLEAITKFIITFANIATQLHAILSGDSSMAIYMQFISLFLVYLKYLSVDYPPKVKKLFDSASFQPIKISFNIHMPLSLTEIVEERPLPDNFSDLSSSFLKNYWGTFLSLAIIYGAAWLLIGIRNLLKKYQRVPLVANLIRRVLLIIRWNYLLSMFLGSLADLFLFSILQLKSFELTSTFSIIDFIMCLLFLIISGFIVVRTSMIIMDIRRDKPKPTVEEDSEHKKESILVPYKTLRFRWRHYKVIFEDYKNRYLIQLAFTLIQMLRTIIFSIIIGALYKYPLLQIILFVVMNLVMIVYQVVLRPYKSRISQAQSIISEFILITANLCVLLIPIFQGYNYEYSNTINAGNGIIYLNLSYFFAMVLFFLIRLGILMGELYREGIKPNLGKGFKQILVGVGKFLVSQAGIGKSSKSKNPIKTLALNVQRKESTQKLNNSPSHTQIGIPQDNVDSTKIDTDKKMENGNNKANTNEKEQSKFSVTKQSPMERHRERINERKKRSRKQGGNTLRGSTEKISRSRGNSKKTSYNYDHSSIMDNSRADMIQGNDELDVSVIDLQ